MVTGYPEWEWFVLQSHQIALFFGGDKFGPVKPTYPLSWVKEAVGEGEMIFFLAKSEGNIRLLPLLFSAFSHLFGYPCQLPTNRTKQLLILNPRIKEFGGIAIPGTRVFYLATK